MKKTIIIFAVIAIFVIPTTYFTAKHYKDNEHFYQNNCLKNQEIECEISHDSCGHENKSEVTYFKDYNCECTVCDCDPNALCYCAPSHWLCKKNKIITNNTNQQ